MKLLLRQRIFSWFDSYDIYDADGNTVYTVKGQLSWGHRFRITDADGREVGEVAERVLTFFPSFEIYVHGKYCGCIRKRFSLFKPVFDMEFNGWHIEGDFMEWNYRIVDSGGNDVAIISKQLFNWSDTYEINIIKSTGNLSALMVVLAIDAEKCSRN